MANKKREPIRIARPSKSTQLHLDLVPGGPLRTYLWLGDAAGVYVGSLSGKATLSRLAHAILQEIGEEPREAK